MPQPVCLGTFLVLKNGYGELGGLNDDVHYNHITPQEKPNMTTTALRMILAAGFAATTLLLTTPIAHAVTNQTSASPGDPVAAAFQNMLEAPVHPDTADRSDTVTTPASNQIFGDIEDPAMTGHIHDPIAAAFCRTLEDPVIFVPVGLSNDPVAMAFRRTLDITEPDSSLTDSETQNDSASSVVPPMGAWVKTS